METINERIRLIINQYYNRNTSLFSRDIGVKQPTMDAIVGARSNDPKAETIEKILNASVVKISAEWLLTGKGSMTKTDSKDCLECEKLKEENEKLKKEIRELKDEALNLHRELKRLPGPAAIPRRDTG